VSVHRRSAEEHHSIDCVGTTALVAPADRKSSPAPSTPVRIRQVALNARNAVDASPLAAASPGVHTPTPELWYASPDGQRHKACVPERPATQPRATEAIAAAAAGAAGARAPRGGGGGGGERDERVVAALFDEIVGWSDDRRSPPAATSSAARAHATAASAHGRGDRTAAVCTRPAMMAGGDPPPGPQRGAGARTEPAGAASPDEFWDERSLRSLFAGVHSPPPRGRSPAAPAAAAAAPAATAGAAALFAPEELFPSLFGWDEPAAVHGAAPGSVVVAPRPGGRCTAGGSERSGAARAGGHQEAGGQARGEAMLQFATWALADELAELLADTRITPVRVWPAPR
jgi:hypothetical protein